MTVSNLKVGFYPVTWPNEENIYFLNMMHFDTVVPSSGVNKVKLVITENIPNTQIFSHFIHSTIV